MFRQLFRVLITEAFETGTKSVFCCPSLVVQQELFAKDPGNVATHVATPAISGGK
jgi:hypothetical protein